MPSIGGSVGRNGQNNKEDVKTVQRLLNQQNLTPLRSLRVDGVAGPATIDTIKHFQSVRVGMKNPDGRVDPNGKTIKKLNESERSASQNSADSSTSKINSTNLSGTRWWRANQRKYPNSTSLDDLEADFREKAKSFIAALKEGGATVSIATTRRNEIRAHLMHYSWCVSKGDVRPSEVPKKSGLDIEWDHGNLKESKKGASEMVRLFHMAYYASLTSNHIRGQAVDMTITWKGDLPIKVPGHDQPTIIRTGPCNGSGNRELHRIGREFGLHKLVKDPPHWSYNGK